MSNLLIVGAGPTGLVLALSLLQRGIPVRIIDEKEGPSIHSKAFGIHARTLEIFAKLGVITPFLERGARVRSIIFHHGKKEYVFKLEQRFLHDTPYPFVLILPQSNSEQILIDAILKLGGRIEWETKLLSLENNQAILSTNDRYTFDWLFGCDGGRSTVRNLLNLPFEGIELPETFLIADVQGKMKANASSIHLFFSNQGLTGIVPFNPDLNRLIFPLKENEKIEENVQAMQLELDKRGCGDYLIPENVRWFSYFKIHRRMVHQLNIGNCFLSGDAAHIHSPAGGQGMNTGIQDAFNLAWKIAQIAKGISPKNLLETYEQERLPIAKTVLKNTTRFTKLMTFVQKTGFFSLFISIFFILKKLAERRIVRALTELSISYKKNFNIEKTWKDFLWQGPKCGERAPDLLLENGSHFFEYLNKTHSILLLFQKKEIFQHKGFETLIMNDPRLMKIYHAQKNSVYFIRPDGIVGFRSRKFNKTKLERYLKRNFI